MSVTAPIGDQRLQTASDGVLPAFACICLHIPDPKGHDM